MQIFHRNLTKELTEALMKRSVSHRNDVSRAKPILLLGLPCAGKSVLLRRTAADCGLRYILADLATDRELAELLQGAADSAEEDTVIRELGRFFAISEENISATAFFFDSGETLGDDLSKLLRKRLPITTVIACNRPDLIDQSAADCFTLQPMTYEEFLSAAGRFEAVDAIRKAASAQHTLPEMLAEELEELFYDYLLCGGFPQAVQSYLDSKNDVGHLRFVHEQIYATIRYCIFRLTPKGCKRSALDELLTYYSEVGACDLTSFRPNEIRRGATKAMYRNEHAFFEEFGLLVPVVKLPSEQEREEQVFYEITDPGLMRFVCNDYDAFYHLDVTDLPMYMFRNVLYGECGKLRIKAKSLAPSRRQFIPLVFENAKTIIGIDTKKTARDRSVKAFLQENHDYQSLSFSGRTKYENNGNHKIQWFNLDAALDCKN